MRIANAGSAWIALAFALSATRAHAQVVYQDFEPDNGTPPKLTDPKDVAPEYGWGFNEAAVSLSIEGEPVHSGSRAWKVTIPSGKPVHAGTGVVSRVQSYDMNVIPECHDRLTFWVWSDPSEVGDHTVMVKFFDQDGYKGRGIGIWTEGKARYRQWTQLHVPFGQLPAEFDLRHIDKVEFFNYWDGTYYYDDISVGSSKDPEQDLRCLEERHVLACSPCADESMNAAPGDEPSEPESAGAPPRELCAQGASSAIQGYDRAIVGLSGLTTRRCRSIYGPNATDVADALEVEAARRLEMIRRLTTGDAQ